MHHHHHHQQQQLLLFAATASFCAGTTVQSQSCCESVELCVSREQPKRLAAHVLVAGTAKACAGVFVWVGFELVQLVPVRFPGARLWHVLCRKVLWCVVYLCVAFECGVCVVGSMCGAVTASDSVCHAQDSSLVLAGGGDR